MHRTLDSRARLGESMNEPLYFYTKTMPYWGLSNFAPPGFAADGVFWPTVEHYFQAQKFESADVRERIRRAATPKEARAMGQSRQHVIRADWDRSREAVMLHALRLKFAARAAADLLISTGDRPLVESSPFDFFWAAGQDGTGQNRLGHLLMQVRAELLQQAAPPTPAA
jgi:N-glycosidase YbiA